MAVLDKGMVHVPGREELAIVRFYHATKNDTQFKTYELFISRTYFCKGVGHS
jgi:hypothetical protein